MGRPKSTWKRELQNELKTEINKTLSEASTVAAYKERWPILYLELNGNYEDDYKVPPISSILFIRSTGEV